MSRPSISLSRSLSQIGEAVQETMSDTLKDYYGVDFHNLRNRQITDAWDKAQEKVPGIDRDI